MKGKVAFYFGMPNVARLRSRLEDAPKELSAELRAELVKITVSVANDANLAIRARMIDYVNSREDLKFKTKEHKAQVLSLMSGIFDTVFTVENSTLKSILGEDEAGEEAPEDAEEAGDDTTAPTEAGAEEVAPKVAPKVAAPKAPKTPVVEADPAGESEFED